jgi:hypothetical protein
VRALYIVTIFASAFLLFLVEPLAAKLILPYFGGSASVWTACLLFFQLALLAGYFYADRVGRLPTYLATAIHLFVLLQVMALHRGFTTSTLSNLHSLAGGGSASVFLALAGLVGLPFFVLSSTAPILQKIFSQTNDSRAANPYFLYAASNLGSLIALIAYPTVVEPYLGLSTQFYNWSTTAGGDILFLVGASLTIGCSRLRKEPVNDAATTPAPAWRERLFWVLLSAGPSSLLLGVTSFLTTSIAPIPLLWVVPLALYLITFIIAFAHKPRFSARGVGRWAAVLVAPLSIAVVLESSEPIVGLAAFHLVAFFVVALGCHLRLSERRPSSDHLTEYYLWLAVGGAVGGLFNALLAPHIFVTLFEYPLALCACCALVLVPKQTKVWEKHDWIWPVGVAGVTLAVILLAGRMPPTPERTFITLGLPAAACFLASLRPVRFGLCLLAFFGIATLLNVNAGGAVRFSGRSFYGVHRVVDDVKTQLRKLTHGNTVHGIESLDPTKRDIPLTYYAKSGPAGNIFKVFHGATMKQNVGLVGLGVGSLAAYGEPGQNMTFFEIDPIVIRVASDPKLFTFLSDSHANVRIVPGDGRLTLAKQPDHSFDLLVLDAFSSDAIPVHLLTEEAIRMYLTKLRPGGFLLFHISNNYVDLAPILEGEANDLGLEAKIDEDTEIVDEDLAAGKEPSTWMVLGEAKTLARLEHGAEWSPPFTKVAKGWTDDRSDLLSAIRLNH